jgi:uncharacterized protein YeaO (DUF488 family)
MVNIYTSQFRYSKPDRLDITYKTGDPVFRPTKELVFAFKNYNITETQYSTRYLELMLNSYSVNRNRWDEVLNMDRITFVCYCANGKFCHRLLLVYYFVQLGAIYKGVI